MLAAMFILVLAGAGTTYLSARRAEKEARQSLLMRTGGAAAALDPAMVAGLTGRPEDEGSPTFEYVRARLIAVHSVNKDCRFAYLLGMKDGQVVFLADAEPANSEDYSAPGEVYEEASPELKAVFQSGQGFTEGPMRDDWGTWVSGLVPILGPGGQVVAALGLDIDAADWPTLVAPYRVPTIPLMTVSGVLMLGTVLFRQRREEVELRHLATHDFLTDIPNRYVLEIMLRRAVAASRRGTPSALLFIDVDNFKLVNDTFTHAAGDEMLATLTGVFRRNLRDEDLIARLGGDEFAVLLDRSSLEAAKVVAERLRAAVDDHRFVIGQQTVDVSLSIGLVAIDGAMAADKILITADTALHAAKERGRNRVVFLGPDDPATLELSEAARMAALVKTALREDRFILHYQPVVRIQGGQIDYHEALIRLQDEGGDLIPPGRFLPVAERFGLMSQIDRWVVESALRTLKENPKIGLFVNLSATSLADEELLARLEEAIKSSGVSPSRLGLEITESAAIRDFASTETWIRRLEELGCRFALDDFGSGFSSFSYLRLLPVDYVKIDGAFIRNMDTEPTHRAFVDAINTIAHTLGKKTVAEFVENEAVLGILRDLRVDYAQGYHLGKPAPYRVENQSQDCAGCAAVHGCPGHGA